MFLGQGPLDLIRGEYQQRLATWERWERRPLRHRHHHRTGGGAGGGLRPLRDPATADTDEYEEG